MLIIDFCLDALEKVLNSQYFWNLGLDLTLLQLESSGGLSKNFHEVGIVGPLSNFFGC